MITNASLPIRRDVLSSSMNALASAVRTYPDHSLSHARHIAVAFK